MKKILTNKKNAVIISVILAALILVSAIVVVSQRNDGPDVDVDVSTTLEGTPGTTGTAGDGTTTEEVTEESSETSDKTQEEDKNSTTDTTTGKNDKETTTKKPNKPETTTKKPVTTTKPSKPDKVPEDVAKDLVYGDYGGKEGYEAHLKEVANYKCNRCGKHDCPSLEYGKDLLGNPDWPSIWPEKCPAIINETAKCPHCGKTLVADDRWLTEPNKYCDGACHLNFS